MVMVKRRTTWVRLGKGASHDSLTLCCLGDEVRWDGWFSNHGFVMQYTHSLKCEFSVCALTAASH